MATTDLQRRLEREETVARFRAGVWRYLRFLGADAAEADDLAQETFLAIFRSPPEWRGDAELASYLRKAARNQLLALRRRQKREVQPADFDIADDVWRRTVGEDLGDDWLTALEDCLAGVNGRARRAVDLFYRQRLTRAETATALEMTENGVKTLLRRTRAALRVCIERKTNR